MPEPTTDEEVAKTLARLPHYADLAQQVIDLASAASDGPWGGMAPDGGTPGQPYMAMVQGPGRGQQLQQAGMLAIILQKALDGKGWDPRAPIGGVVALIDSHSTIVTPGQAPGGISDASRQRAHDNYRFVTGARTLAPRLAHIVRELLRAIEHLAPAEEEGIA